MMLQIYSTSPSLLPAVDGTKVKHFVINRNGYALLCSSILLSRDVISDSASLA